MLDVGGTIVGPLIDSVRGIAYNGHMTKEQMNAAMAEAKLTLGTSHTHEWNGFGWDLLSVHSNGRSTHIMATHRGEDMWTITTFEYTRKETNEFLTTMGEVPAFTRKGLAS